MTKPMSPLLAEGIARQPAMQRALDLANRDAVLEHARMGRSVCESRGGQIVWITPEEIFARYGLDENGRPKPGTPADPGA